MSRDLGRLVPELYALPLKDFTRARNAKAAALKAAGRGDDAQAVRQLRRPPVTLWATNQLGRAEPKRLDAFLRTVDELRRTQLRDPRAASDALRRQRAELDALVGRATELLAGQGHRATPATQRRISDTLLGAAVERRRAEDLRAGRLTEELSAPGFEVLTAAPRGGHLRLVASSKSADERVLRARSAERQAQAEQDRERRGREAEALEREAAARRSAADSAQRELEELTRKTTEARQRLRDAQRAAKGAAAAHRKAASRSRGPGAERTRSADE